MELDIINKLKIIKSTKKKATGISEESVYLQCYNSEEVLCRLEELQAKFDADPSFETLHGLVNYLSISYRHRDTLDEVKFYASD